MEDKAISDYQPLQLIWMEPLAQAFKAPDYLKELFCERNFLVPDIIIWKPIFVDFSYSIVYREHMMVISLRWSYKFHGQLST